MIGRSTIGLSILSWRGAETLENSLQSYAKAGLFDVFDEVQVFLPDSDSAVRDVVAKYAVRAVEHPENLGIMGNLIEAAKAISTDYLLMVENDCPLIAPIQTVRARLSRALDIMENDAVVAARFRSVANPGEPTLPGPIKYKKLFEPGVLNGVKRFLRPGKVRRLSGYAAYVGQDAMNRHGEYFEDLGDGYILIDNKIGNWTNQSALVRRQKFLEELIPAALASRSGRGANGLPNLEIEMNRSPIWRNSGWKTLLTPGLFTHERVGYRGYD